MVPAVMSHRNPECPSALNQQENLCNTVNSSFHMLGNSCHKIMVPDQKRTGEMSYDLILGKPPAYTEAVSKSRAWGQPEQGMQTSLRT